MATVSVAQPVSASFGLDMYRRLYKLHFSQLVPVQSQNVYIYVISLIIHEGKKKEISAMTEVVYVIQNPPDLHKLFVRFS